MEDIESGLVRWLRVTNLGDYRPQPKFHLLLTWAVSNHPQPIRWCRAHRARTGEVSPPPDQPWPQPDLWGLFLWLGF